MLWFIVGWITVIVFLRVCHGLLSSSYSLCWILLLVWFLAWSALITLHLPWWICIGFHTHSALHTNCVWSCLSACVVLPLLILLTIALVLLWCLVDRLWDLLLMVKLLYPVIGLTGVWDLLRWLQWPQQLECFACWFEVFLFWFRYICKALKTHLFGLAYSRQSTHFWVCITFCRVRHGDSVTKPDYYYYYYYSQKYILALLNDRTWCYTQGIRNLLLLLLILIIRHWQRSINIERLMSKPGPFGISNFWARPAPVLRAPRPVQVSYPTNFIYFCIVLILKSDELISEMHLFKYCRNILVFVTCYLFVPCHAMLEGLYCGEDNCYDRKYMPVYIRGTQISLWAHFSVVHLWYCLSCGTYTGHTLVFQRHTVCQKMYSSVLHFPAIFISTSRFDQKDITALRAVMSSHSFPRFSCWQFSCFVFTSSKL